MHQLLLQCFNVYDHKLSHKSKEFLHTPVQLYHLVSKPCLHTYRLQPPSYVGKYNGEGGLNNYFRLLSLGSYVLRPFVIASEVRQTSVDFC